MVSVYHIRYWVILPLLAASTLAFGGQKELNQAMHSSIKNRDLASLKKTLDGGANPNARDNDGVTALMNAARYSKGGATALLLEKGASPNRAIKNGRTALFFAANEGTGGSTKKLIEAGAKVGIRDANGQTALMVAVRKRNWPAALEIAPAAAKNKSINVRDNTGQSAIDYLISDLSARNTKQAMAVFTVLLASGAKIGVRGDPQGAFNKACPYGISQDHFCNVFYSTVQQQTR